MYGMSAACIKRGRLNGNCRAFPKEGTERHRIYSALLRNGEFVVVRKGQADVIQQLDRDYGIVTRSVGKGRYVLVSLDGG